MLQRNQAMATRKTFGPDLDIDRSIYSVDSVDDMSEKTINGWAKTFAEIGFVVLACRSTARHQLLSLAPLLGSIVQHNRGDAFGVLSVNATNPQPGFIDSENSEHPLHTDGAFKDQPEKIVALQCVVPAEEGGTTVLTSASYAYNSLTSDQRAALYDTDAVTIRRNHQRSTKPLFRENGDGRVEFSFRYDNTATTTIKPTAQDGFEAFRKNLYAGVIKFDLQPGWILVLDNTAIGHGRTAFPQASRRHYNRMNADGRGLANLEIGFQPS
jgi:alpha-ketoglutarate-dependent taurine dioxygenase